MAIQISGSTFRSILASAASICLATLAGAQESGVETQMTIENDVAVTTREGYDVFVNVYRPVSPGKYPTLVTMGPYGKDDLPANYSGTFGNGQIQVSEYAAFETPDPEYWVHNDYVVVAADSPGSGRSGGDLAVYSTEEAQAFYDVIEWAAAQEWSNGNVGLSGVSYFAMSQWFVAALHPPHLKAISPTDGLTDMYRDIVRHGGIPEDGFLGLWVERRLRRAKRPDARLVVDYAADAQAHPLYDDYWKSTNPPLGEITVPAYVVASWSDQGLHTRGTLLGYQAIASEQKWLEIHGRKKWEYYYQRETLERQKRFFDYFLRGIENGMDRVPRVRYERRNGFYDGTVDGVGAVSQARTGSETLTG